MLGEKSKKKEIKNHNAFLCSVNFGSPPLDAF